MKRFNAWLDDVSSKMTAQGDRLRRYTESFALIFLMGFDVRPLVEEVKRGLARLDEVQCSHCGLTDHSDLRSQVAAKQRGEA